MTSAPSFSNVEWKQVAAGGEHTLFVDSDRRVFSCGLVENGRLGIGPTMPGAKDHPTLAHVDTAGEPVEHIAAGEYHSIYSTPSGRIFTFGSGSVGQLGLNSNADQNAPKEIALFKALRRPIRSLAAGEAATFIVLEDGSVFSFGLDEHGNLGLAATMVRSGASTKHTERYGFGARGVRSRSIPQHVEALSKERVRRVAAGAHHTLFLCESGKMYGCGSNAEGQLGMGDEVKKSTIPRVIALPEALQGTPVVDIACGAHHSAALLQGGTVVVFGTNCECAMGVGEDQAMKLSRATALDGLPPMKTLACGAAHTALLAANEVDIYVAGWGKSGRLGLGEAYCNADGYTNAAHFTKMLELEVPAESVVCGTHSTHVVLKDGRVISWGCGGRGQLGNTVCKDAVGPTMSTNTVQVLHGTNSPSLENLDTTLSNVGKAVEKLREELEPTPTPIDPRHQELKEYAQKMQQEPAAGECDMRALLSSPTDESTTATVAGRGKQLATAHPNVIGHPVTSMHQCPQRVPGETPSPTIATTPPPSLADSVAKWGNVSGIHTEVLTQTIPRLVEEGD